MISEKPQITILTHPVGATGTFVAGIKKAAKKILGRPAGGHMAVVESLAAGLRELNISFSLDPMSSDKISPTVLVLSSVPALRQAIDLKRQGKISKLIAGPTLVVNPNDFAGILADKAIDVCLVPSDIVLRTFAKQSPQIANKLAVWPAGVDIKYWKPDEDQAPKKQVTLYIKRPFDGLTASVESVIQQKGYTVNKIVYGKYSQTEYKSALNQSLAAVFLSPTESQGIALAEAWAMDVPTLAWNPELPHEEVSEIIRSSAPYLTDATGKFWKEPAQLEKLLSNLPQLLPNFHPRAWVLENMSNKKSAEIFLKVCNIK